MPDQIFAVGKRVQLPEKILEKRLVGFTTLDYDLK
jgi:hypothetical protein